MRKIREGVFETNSSSTHSLVYNNKENYGFKSPNSKLVIEFIDTNDYYSLSTLKEKVSYLASQIINKYKYDALNYEDLIEDVKNNSSFKRIENYVKEKYNKEIVFPEKYTGNIEDIVEINHQLTYWDNFEELLREICEYDKDYLADVLASNTIIRFGSN